jgi:hypothetical protein
MGRLNNMAQTTDAMIKWHEQHWQDVGIANDDTFPNSMLWHTHFGPKYLHIFGMGNGDTQDAASSFQQCILWVCVGRYSPFITIDEAYFLLLSVDHTLSGPEETFRMKCSSQILRSPRERHQDLPLRKNSERQRYLWEDPWPEHGSITLHGPFPGQRHAFKTCRQS